MNPEKYKKWFKKLPEEIVFQGATWTIKDILVQDNHPYLLLVAVGCNSTAAELRLLDPYNKTWHTNDPVLQALVNERAELYQRMCEIDLNLEQNVKDMYLRYGGLD